MTVKIKNSQRKHRVDIKRLMDLALSVLQEFGLEDNELSVLLVSNQAIRLLNNKYLQRDNPTDVLAFAQCDAENSSVPFLLGDVVISVEEAFIQSQKRRLDFMREVALYLVHGMLHLLGYDDISSDDFKKMSRTQQRILRKYYDSQNKK